ncbi:alpha/beta hydrolase [Nocardia harenae]|uniref:alpha/beta hydrolase n=1 Tax=Nocardia harenae TaxID=358707 RepID=UPI000837700D|nr:alpha/beta fold hydrolase [Nocardia harenae]
MEIISTPVMFAGGDGTLAGRLYRATADPFARHPGIVVTGSWLTVKEQMAHTYATALAARGFAVLTLDHAGFGESPGHPAAAELPGRKIADITAAVRYAATLSVVAGDRVGYLGVCAGAQYGFAAAAAGAPVAALASVAGWFHDTATVAPFYGGRDGVDLRLRRGAAALEHYRSTGQVTTVPAYEPGNDRAGMFIDLDYYADPARGAIDAWPNRMAELSWQPWLGYEGITPAAAVTVPSLFVHSADCVFPDIVRDLATRLGARAALIESAGGQTDHYDRPAQVTLAADAAADHFRTALEPR